MRKFTLMFVALFVATMAFAQKAMMPRMANLNMTPAKVAFAAPHKGGVMVTPTTKKVNYVSKRKIEAVSELAGPAVILNNTYFSDPQNDGGSATITVDEENEDVIWISNLVPSATNAIYAEVDWENGTVSIEPGQVLFTHQTYGDIVLAAIDTESEQGAPDLDAFIEGEIDEDGVITFYNWSDYIKEGQYAGYYWDNLYYRSLIFPANGKMDVAIYGGDEAESWNVVMFQTADTVTVYNFANHGQPVDVVLKQDKTLKISSQLGYDISQEQEEIADFVTVAADWSRMALTSYTIEGTATEDELTFADWTLFSSTKGNITGRYSDTRIYYIDGEKFSFDFEEPEPDMPVVAPDGLETEVYNFKATQLSYNDDDELVETPVTLPVNVGFDGDDVYVQGLCTYLPEAWVKGTFVDGQAVFATGQYFGIYREQYDMYFLGYDLLTDKISDVVFDYDEDAKIFTTDQHVYVNGEKNTIYYYRHYGDITMEKVTDVAATPQDPEIAGFAPYNEKEGYGQIAFVMPLESVEGEEMLAAKLYYQIFTKTTDDVEAPYVFTPDLYTKIEEDMTYVPYTFNDDYDFNEFQGVKIVYLNFPTSEYKAFGVQAFYLGGNEVNASNLVWKENPETTGISAATAGSVAKVSYTDLSGRTVAQPTHGLYIMTMKMADGTKKSVKMLIK